MKQLDLKLIINEKKKDKTNFSFILENIHNYIYANDGLGPSESLDVVINILFLKAFDELKSINSFYIKNNEYLEVTNGKRNKDFFLRMENLRIQTFVYFKDLFDKAQQIKIKDYSLAYVVKMLADVNILKSNDLFGKAFLKYLSSSQRNSRGQFFTPDEVVNFCINFLKPKKNDKILDPACGSGSFLISAAKYISNKNSSNLNLNNIFGFEISPTAAKITKLNMILANIKHENIIISDALKNIKKIKTIGSDLQEVNLKNYFDLIITNPPFGTTGKISDKTILKDFKLGSKWNEVSQSYINSEKLLPNQVPEVLFIERCLDLLKPNGKIAIILPNGNLENSSLKYVRYFINYNCNILSVIKLPQDVFVHSGTGIKTSILFLEKKKSNKSDIINSKDVFFSQITKIGFSANKTGRKIYKKDELGNTIRDKNGNSIMDEDFSDVLLDYNNLNIKNKKKSKNSFIIKAKNFSYNRYNYEYYNPKYKQIYLNFNNQNSFFLKDLVSIKKNKSNKLLSTHLSVSYVELSDVIADYSEIQKSEILKVHELPSRASYEINKGDIITSVSGNSIGTKKHASAIVSEEFKGSICSNGFRVFYDFSKKLDKYYFLYYLKTDLFLNQVFRLRTGSAIPSLQDNDLMNIQIYIPSNKKTREISLLMKKGYEDRIKYRNAISKIKI